MCAARPITNMQEKLDETCLAWNTFFADDYQKLRVLITPLHPGSLRTSNVVSCDPERSRTKRRRAPTRQLGGLPASVFREMSGVSMKT